ncbi:MAG: SDR family oxidoreductase [Candidatus Altiarchaeota archaeon]|nr:SDR family oxidoreductase [Candidatus Altiarchaeota archaeon]
MRVVVTGGAGFIGSHLCERLLRDGNKVVCVDNLVTGSLKNIKHLRNKKDFEFLKQDVSEKIQVAGKVDYVMHFASPASPIDYLELPIETLKVGSLGTYNTLDLAKYKKAKYFLASTSEVYGDPLVNPQPETYWGNVNSVGPRSVYDEAKRFSEALTMAYHRVYKIDTKIVRIFNTYGPRMRRNDGRVVPSFIDSVLNNKPITIFGDGSQTRSFCYVDDLVEGIVRLMNSGLNEPVNLGNPSEITVLEFARIIKKLTNSDSELAYRNLPTDDPKVRRPDITKAKTKLGWQPKVSLEEGLLKTIDYFKNC